jgi:hypothetical protein
MEILLEHHGMGELRLVMPALARLGRGDGDRAAFPTLSAGAPAMGH